MNESQDPEESQNESLADVPPQPVIDAPLARAANVGLGSIAITVAGAGALFLISGAMMPTVGATRSAKLEWERRKLQINQAASERAESDDTATND